MTLATEAHVPFPIDAEARTPLGSSWRLRRLVVGGHVLFDPITLTRPAMRPKELALATALMSRSRQMVEFGAGGSTTLALKLGVSHLVAVESDLAWINRLRSDEAAARAIADGRLEVLHADIGPIASLGAPATSDSRHKWPAYAAMPWAHVDADGLDLVLIDGRFRVACVLETILRAPRRTLIAIHDFWNRPAYHAVLEHLDVISRCERLGVFQRKTVIDRAEVSRQLETAVFCPD